MHVWVVQLEELGQVQSARSVLQLLELCWALSLDLRLWRLTRP